MAERPETDLLNIHVNIRITPTTLKAIVGHAKRLTSQTAKDTFHIDTADFVSAMVSRFLEERDFESYAQNETNYSSPPTFDLDV